MKWRGKKNHLVVFCPMCDGGNHSLCQLASCLCRRINPELHKNAPTGLPQTVIIGQRDGETG